MVYLRMYLKIWSLLANRSQHFKIECTENKHTIISTIKCSVLEKCNTKDERNVYEYQEERKRGRGLCTAIIPQCIKSFNILFVNRTIIVCPEQLVTQHWLLHCIGVCMRARWIVWVHTCIRCNEIETIRSIDQSFLSFFCVCVCVLYYLPLRSIRYITLPFRLYYTRVFTIYFVHCCKMFRQLLLEKW